MSLTLTILPAAGADPERLRSIAAERRLATSDLQGTWTTNELLAAAGLDHHRDPDPNGFIVHRFSDLRTGQSFGAMDVLNAGAAAIALLRLRGL